MTDHNHEFGIPDGYVDPSPYPVDIALLDRFVGAAFDGCPTCQDAELTLLVSDATSCARLVDLACGMMGDIFGGALPPSTYDPAAPGVAALEFRALVRAGLDGKSEAVVAACQAMTPTARRKAVNTAADIIVGLLSQRRPT